MKREGIRMVGLVQGVGFRPFVAKLARRYNLTGFILNDEEGVYGEFEGLQEHMDAFLVALYEELPPLARLDGVTRKVLPCKGDGEFSIVPSRDGSEKNTLLSPDTAPCEACLKEFRHSANRRYKYPFINCTHCGPRYTLIEKIPYDRENTSMASFTMCDDCHKEYGDEEDRRYHAEPTACSLCGPHYSFAYGDFPHIEGDEAVLERGKGLLKEGYILAIKGIGGYHLMCDASREDVVQRLRALKKRPTKPLAIMAGSLKRAQLLCHISKKEEEYLTSKERPIVLLERKDDDLGVAPSVAIDTSYLGVMLPYTPMNEMLLDEEMVVVCTSANDHGDPVLYDDEEAMLRLRNLCDFMIYNNRTIVAPVDDSLLMVVRDEPIFLRRARGYVPLPVLLKEKSPQDFLCTGSDLKNTFALVKHKWAILSPHMGDLSNFATYERYEETINHLSGLFGMDVSAVVSDHHPNYYSSLFAGRVAEEQGWAHVHVQHHHAHIGAVMAEYGLDETVLGIALDGTGYGRDGAIWGGEILSVNRRDFKRLGHIAYAPLPGGEIAVKEPWRQALWYIQEIYGAQQPSYIEKWKLGLPPNWKLIEDIIPLGQRSPIPMPLTSSMGRLFDVVGCLLGLGYKHDYDGHIPMALEQLAGREEGYVLPYEIKEDDGLRTISFMKTLAFIIEALSEDDSQQRKKILAASFHKTVAHAFVAISRDCMKEASLKKVLLGGGVFQNRRLLMEFYDAWPEGNYYVPHQVPPNDGGLSLGQAWIGMKLF